MKQTIVKGIVLGFVVMFMAGGVLVTRAGGAPAFVQRIMNQISEMQEAIVGLNEQVSGIEAMQQLVVVDANGDEVGIYLGPVWGKSTVFNVFDTNFGASGEYNPYTGKLSASFGVPPSLFGFSGTSCTGQAYANGVTNTQTFIGTPLGTYVGVGSVVQNQPIASQYNLLGACYDTTPGTMFSVAAPIDPVSTSYVAPLQVMVK